MLCDVQFWCQLTMTEKWKTEILTVSFYSQGSWRAVSRLEWHLLPGSWALIRIDYPTHGRGHLTLTRQAAWQSKDDPSTPWILHPRSRTPEQADPWSDADIYLGQRKPPRGQTENIHSKMKNSNSTKGAGCFGRTSPNRHYPHTTMADKTPISCD